jgi:hypothetical protein
LPQLPPQNSHKYQSHPLDDMMFGPSMMHPPQYPTKQPSQLGNMMNYFKTPEGGLDLNKMMNTYGQVKSTYSQVSPFVKSMGSVFSLFK